MSQVDNFDKDDEFVSRVFLLEFLLPGYLYRMMNLHVYRLKFISLVIRA